MFKRYYVVKARYRGAFYMGGQNIVLPQLKLDGLRGGFLKQAPAVPKKKNEFFLGT